MYKKDCQLLIIANERTGIYCTFGRSFSKYLSFKNPISGKIIAGVFTQKTRNYRCTLSTSGWEEAITSERDRGGQQ